MLSAIVDQRLVAAVEVADEPTIRLLDPPLLDVAQQAALRAEQRRLDAAPGWFDGPLLILLDADPLTQPGRLTAALASYAWVALGRDRPGLPLSVACMLHDGAGQWLWARTAPGTSGAGSWGVSAAGGVDCPSPNRSMRAEVREELGLSDDAVAGLAPRLLALVDRPGRGVAASLLYTGQVDRHAPLQLAADEVSETCWLTAGAVPDGPHSPAVVALIERLQAAV